MKDASLLWPSTAPPVEVEEACVEEAVTVELEAELAVPVIVENPVEVPEEVPVAVVVPFEVAVLLQTAAVGRSVTLTRAQMTLAASRVSIKDDLLARNSFFFSALCCRKRTYSSGRLWNTCLQCSKRCR